MKRIARFQKVSKEQFLEGTEGILISRDAEKAYEELMLPKRATKGSAGYDFFTPYPITIAPGETVKIPTGSVSGWKRSGCSSVIREVVLDLSTGFSSIIPWGSLTADYYYSDNEGHIFAKLTNDTNEGKTISLKAGEGFMQGIFVEYGITLDDDAKGIRNGGFGSTTI